MTSCIRSVAGFWKLSCQLIADALSLDTNKVEKIVKNNFIDAILVIFFGQYIDRLSLKLAIFMKNNEMLDSVRQ